MEVFLKFVSKCLLFVSYRGLGTLLMRLKKAIKMSYPLSWKLSITWTKTTNLSFLKSNFYLMKTSFIFFGNWKLKKVVVFRCRVKSMFSKRIALELPTMFSIYLIIFDISSGCNRNLFLTRYRDDLQDVFLLILAAIGKS